MGGYPRLMHTAIDTTDCRGLAEFYRELLGAHYRPGDEPPVEGSPDDADWLVLLGPDERRLMAFQQVDRLDRTTWPEHDVPMQMHMDFRVEDRGELDLHRGRAEALGAEVLLDRSDDEHEPLYVLADPCGHPFCLCVAP